MTSKKVLLQAPRHQHFSNDLQIITLKSAWTAPCRESDTIEDAADDDREPVPAMLAQTLGDFYALHKVTGITISGTYICAKLLTYMLFFIVEITHIIWQVSKLKFKMVKQLAQDQGARKKRK